MYNLLVSGSGWAPNRDTMMVGRMFEYTSDQLTSRFKPNGVRWTPIVRQPEPLFNIKSFVSRGACGYVGEGEHFPALRAGSGGRGSGAGRQSRSSTYP